MPALLKRLTPFLLVFFTLMLVDATITSQYADARSRGGGRSFSSPMRQTAPTQQAPAGQYGQQRQQQQPAAGGFGRGMMGGLVGGALGAMLFGSLFGMGGDGMGILPLLLLGGVGFFLYKRFANRPSAPSSAGYQPPPDSSRFQAGPGHFGGNAAPPVPPIREARTVEQGLDAIRLTDPGFDEKYFLEVASDVFFKVQAGWMRRDLDSCRHLLGSQLAAEYADHFARMREAGQINKLESIAIRGVEITDAGSENGEDYVTVLFTANLLDYTVDDTTGALVEGSMTEPVKFAEHWTWARPVRTEDWKLEGIDVVGE